MKRLTDKELAIICDAASYLTKHQDEDSHALYLASFMWEIYNRHMTDDRFSNVIRIERTLIAK